MSNKNIGMPARVAALIFTALFIAACGGGDGGGGGGGGQPAASLVVTSTTLSVSATISDPAPTGQINTYISADPNSTTQYYILGKYSDKGIATISGAGDGNAANYTVQFKSPASLGVGTYTDTVTVQGCYDKACTQQVQNSPQTVSVTYIVTESPPSLISLSPSAVNAGGGAFVLMLVGTGFSATSVVQWNGSARPTTFVSSTELTASIGASDIATAGGVPVSVASSASAGAPLTNVVYFSIQTLASLGLHSIYPSVTLSQGPTFVLTALGQGFLPSAVIQWNGAARPTTFVSQAQLQAQIPATDIAAVGMASITVLNSQGAGGTSAALTLTVKAAAPDAVAFQITPSHSGAVTFNSLSFPAASAWSVDVGGPPSYALVADGKVFVTVQVGTGSQLIALDQSTGATVWGPIVLSGNSNAAYDGGKIFVVSSTIGTAALMQSYDGASGVLGWSSVLAGQYSFSSGPTALNGLVYTGGAGSGGTLYALNEASGALAWTQGVANGDDSTPAVTDSGVYVTYPCSTYAFQPATGSSLFNNNTGCDGGGGGTPVVANGVLYSPNGFGSYNGSTFNSLTGALLGSYVADDPPAIGSQMGYFLQSGTLRGLALSNNTVVWSFAGDGLLVTSPILVGQNVIVGSSSGNVYALDASTGTQVWTVNAGAAIVPGAHWGAGLPLSGLAAGDGLLVVPAGTKVVAYVLSTNP